MQKVEAKSTFNWTDEENVEFHIVYDQVRTYVL